MSWGERTCLYFGQCNMRPTILTCNEQCSQYERKFEMVTTSNYQESIEDVRNQLSTVTAERDRLKTENDRLKGELGSEKLWHETYKREDGRQKERAIKAEAELEAVKKRIADAPIIYRAKCNGENELCSCSDKTGCKSSFNCGKYMILEIEAEEAK